MTSIALQDRVMGSQGTCLLRTSKAFDKHAKMLNYAFEESQGIIYSKNK
jgi:hypothetical protein